MCGKRFPALEAHSVFSQRILIGSSWSFSWLCLAILVSRNAIGMCSLIGRGEDDLRLGCKAQLLAFLVLFLYIFLNYMCHLISFVGLVLAIVRGVAPVSTIELARKEKKVLVCMCRFRSSSVVLSLDLIPELRHSWNTFLSVSSGWHPESPCGWTGSWRGKPRSGNILYIYLYQKHLTYYSITRRFLMENGLRLFVPSSHPLLPFLRVRS